MATLSQSALTQALLRALDRPNPTLFAGAGVGRRVALPDWPQYLEQLAKNCEAHGQDLEASLIRKRTAQRQYLAAATVYKTCEAIPQGEMWKRLAEPFDQRLEPQVLDRLVPLVGLRFSAIVTTNFDHSLHEAAALARIWSRPVERDDGSLRGASLISEFFVARIHGRAEMPTSMVIDAQDYRSLDADSTYLDFLLDILRNRSCIFLGFSFYDPALSHVLKVFEERFGPVYRALHSAIVPADDYDLCNRLQKLNIETLSYDRSDDHKVVWRAIREASTIRSQGSVLPVKAEAPVGGLHRFMAFSYSQVQRSRDAQPVAAIIQDGIVLAEISSQGGVSEATLTEKLSQILRVSPNEATELVSGSLGRLVARHQVEVSRGIVERLGQEPNALEADIDGLAGDVLDRMRVRAGTPESKAARAIARAALEGVFVARAWDLAAHFAGSASGWGLDLRMTVDRIVSEAAKQEKIAYLPALSAALVDTLQTPEDRQAPVLMRLGRAAFGLQLVLATPRQVLFQRHALPEKIYLDANVLMPALTDGHPLQPAYAEALARLDAAGGRAGARLEVAVGEQFLNEIISHRYIGGEIVRELGLEDPVKLNQHILFYGATNTNVFVAAYAAAVSPHKNKLSFAEFLRGIAPYEDEKALADHLVRSGIAPVKMEFFGTAAEYFTSVLNPLREGYERHLQPQDRPKRGLLIEHEASQLAQLRSDAQAGRRVLFVTADSKLRRILQDDSRLHDLAGVSVSQLGLIALVDVMVGFEPDSRAASRLVWAQSQSDAEKSLFEYFVALGLRSYEEGMALEMQEAARRVAGEAAHELRRTKLDLHGRAEESLTATARFLDTYENEFFRNWREAIDKKEAEDR